MTPASTKTKLKGCSHYARIRTAPLRTELSVIDPLVTPGLDAAADISTWTGYGHSVK